jgi:DNA-binding MarR family transcriptional regulator
MSAVPTYTTTPPVAPAVEIRGSTTGTEVLDGIVEDHHALGVLVTAVGDAVPHATHYEAIDAIEADRRRASFGAAVALGKRTALRSLRHIGGGSEAVTLADVRWLCDLAGDADLADTPTVAIHLPDEIQDIDPRTREAYLKTVVALASVYDVHLVASRVDLLWLAKHHRELLPRVSETWNREAPLDTPAALETAAPGTRGERLLQALVETDTETLTYSEAYSTMTVSKGRVRQLLGDLADAGVVRIYGDRSDRRVELTSAGREFYEEEIATQRRLSDCVSDRPKFSKDSRVLPHTHVETAPTAETPPDGPADRVRLPDLHEVRYLDRYTAAATLGTADPGSISVVDYPVDPQTDRAEGRWHVEDDRLVVSCEGDNPMQVWTTLALTLADYRTFDRLLTEERLEDHDVLAMLEDGKSVLRGMRTIGWLPDDVDSYEDLVNAVRGAAEELGELTREYRESDDDTLRSAITRDALGLAGSLTQLCDLAGVEVVRLIKFPEFSRRFDEERSRAIFRSLALGAAVGSAYGHHTVYRHLFEDRPDKRAQAFEPTVDAANPTARLGGSFVLVGDFAGKADQVADDVEDAFAGLDPHDDAPEIRLRSELYTSPTRQQVTETARRVLQMRDLNATPVAVSLLHGLAQTTFDVADALARLDGGNDGRDVDVREIRYALTQLDSGRLLRGYDGRCTTPRKLLAALLDATVPLTERALADAAGVSQESLREHLDDLEALRLVERTDDDRLEIALSDRDEYTDHTPWWVEPPTRPDVRAAARALTVARDGVTDAGWPYDRPTDPPDLREVHHAEPWIEDLAPALWGLEGREEYRDQELGRRRRSIAAGPTISQTPLGGATPGDAQTI